jgi:non-ribosomal peptide synthetase component F
MIADGTQAADGNRATLDDLFRRAGVRRSDAPALSEPHRSLSYAQADRAISALATRLRAMGLSTDAVVAMQLPNSVESVIAWLGILRAGMIAAPLPLLWGRQEIVAALSRVGPKAIVTSSAQAGIAMEVAAELFPIRAVAAFGPDLPDGVATLGDVFVVDSGAGDFFQTPIRPGNAAAHVAAITFDVTGDGIAPLPRSHSDLIAGGFAAFRAAGIGDDATVLSTIPISSFAGIALTLVPWLLSGGTLALHHGFNPEAFAQQCHTHDVSVVVLPGRTLPLLTEADLPNQAKTILALWRTPEALAAAAPWQDNAILVDIACFSEAELHSARRGWDGRPAAIPSKLSMAGFTTIGGYRFRQFDIETAVTAADSAAIIAALPDALLGQRLAGSAPYPADVAAELQARGVNALITGAFRQRIKAA